MDLELHFKVDFTHLTATKDYFEMLCFLSLGMSLFSILCFRIPILLHYDDLRVLIERAKTHEKLCVLKKAKASYAVLKNCRYPVEEPVFDSTGNG